jgi:hypothetical protein
VSGPPKNKMQFATPILRLSTGVKRDPAIDLWLDARTPALGSIARTWFLRMRKCGRDVRELMHDGCPVACVEDAPFAYVNVFRAHANVGFFYGAELADPMALLEGNGKRMRHVKVNPHAELDSGALSALIDAAYADIKARLDLERFIVGARGSAD